MTERRPGWNEQLKERSAELPLINSQLESLPDANKPKKEMVSKTVKKNGKANRSVYQIGGSALFKLVGGKYHDIEIRAYAPWEPIRFPNGDTYAYHPHPVGNRSKRHVYMKQ